MNIEKMKSIVIFIFLFFITIPMTNFLLTDMCHAAVREKLEFNENWKFKLGDSADYTLPSFDDENWRNLNLPHDWSIEGEFEESNPAGINGGALPGGIGWYRKTFYLDESDKVKKVYITFDGVYHNSEVYLNGELLGKRPNGYISFQYDMTPYLKYGSSVNLLAVRVDNSDQPNSRWYSGSGIYRNVWLEVVNPVHIDLWGTHVTTPQVSETNATVQIDTVINNTTLKNEQVEIETRILDPADHVINKQIGTLSINKESTDEISQTMSVPSPTLWRIENPYLYKVVSIVKMNHQIIDDYETPFGIRYFRFDVDKGFFLNGKPVKIKGVCNHHDLGALGSALNTRAKERQLEILKAMGCNSIRTSHNPPSPELLQLCDQMGIIILNESFDVWAKKKVEYDYAKDWDQWHEQDLKDHLLRDRNHPCIFMWSIGNEILEQWDTTGGAIALELSALVKKYAPGIPVTSGLNGPWPDNHIYASGALDLVGFNYHHELFEEFPAQFPGEKFIATETTSSLSSRGEYDMPSDEIRIWPYSWDKPFYDGNPDNTCSSYDNCRVPWGSTHSETWKLIKKHDYLSGLYIWTGFDYLGEPTPYQWPSRSSYFGLVDLAGFPKDAYYFYQSEWTENPVLHIFPHWNWDEGEIIDVWAYTNFDQVELFLNEESLGVKTKQDGELHLQWSVVYTPGTIKAVGENTDGDTKEVVIHTAGEPAKIKLIADRNVINADRKDLSFVTVHVLDKDNNLVPTADNLIEFTVSGAVTLAAVDNGKQTSHESFTARHRRVYNGKCLAILKSKENAGTAVLTATSEGLEEDSIKITTQ